MINVQLIYDIEVIADIDDDWINSMVITNTSIRNMGHWVQHPIVRQYSLSPDWDNRWRCGGNLEEVIDESHLSGAWQKKAIKVFCKDREKRLDLLKENPKYIIRDW